METWKGTQVYIIKNNNKDNTFDKICKLNYDNRMLHTRKKLILLIMS